MVRISFTFLCLFSLFTLASPVAAEMVLCDGIWTNSDCKGISQSSVNSKKELTPEQEALVRARSKKSSLLHDITMKSIEAKRTHGVDLSIESVREVCREDSASIDDCRDKIEKFSDRLATRVEQAVRIASAAKEDKEDEVKQEKAQSTNTVVIIEDRPKYIVRPRGRHGGHGGHSNHTGANASFNLKGRTGSGNYSINVETGGSSHSHTRQHRSDISTKTQASGNINTVQNKTTAAVTHQSSDKPLNVVHGLSNKPSSSGRSSAGRRSAHSSR